MPWGVIRNTIELYSDTTRWAAAAPLHGWPPRHRRRHRQRRPHRLALGEQEHTYHTAVELRYLHMEMSGCAICAICAFMTSLKSCF